MAKKRTNVIPIIEDADTHQVRMLVGMVDVIFSMLLTGSGSPLCFFWMVLLFLYVRSATFVETDGMAL
ncbi:hypothetical protein IC575_021367 [Cucumis melo]